MTSELGRKILKDVSRSFYLTLRLLPAGFREPASLGYLLARTSDTLADSEGWTELVRLESLDSFTALLSEESKVEAAQSWLGAIDLSKIPDPREATLLSHVPAMIVWLQTLPLWQREAIREVVETITEGQRWDLTYFDRDGYTRVEKATELEKYTYQVAGCVGEFWTKIGVGLAGEKGFSSLSAEQLMSLGRQYGQGLQLVNILRDVVEDEEKGRCYLPKTEQSPERLFDDHFQETYRPHLEEAQVKLEAGLEYAQSLKSRRLRLATILPARLGLRTLDLLRNASPEDLKARPKITRREVRQELWRGLF